MKLPTKRRRTAKRAAQVWIASQVGRVAARRAARRWRKPAAVLAGGATVVVVAATVRRRRARQADLPYGPPNESVPSHETLAPSQEQAATT